MAKICSPPSPTNSRGARVTWLGQFCLRPTSHLARWLREDFSCRIVEDKPLEVCHDPVALHVNRESRIHTLRRYVPIHHPKFKAAAFYFNPRSDLLCLTIDVDRHYLTDLRTLYGTQLDRFETVLVDQYGCWDDPQVGSELLGFFGGVSVVQVLLESWEFEDDRGPASEEEYVGASRALRDRDFVALKERKWAVQYLNRRCNIYNELKAETQLIGV